MWLFRLLPGSHNGRFRRLNNSLSSAPFTTHALLASKRKSTKSNVVSLKYKTTSLKSRFRREKATKVMIKLLGLYTEENASQARDDAQRCIVTSLKDPNTFLLDHLLTLKPVKFLEGEPIHDVGDAISHVSQRRQPLILDLSKCFSYWPSSCLETWHSICRSTNRIKPTPRR